MLTMWHSFRVDKQDVLFGGSVPDGYREYLEPVIFRPWAERLVDFVALQRGQTVLDVAAGTGVVSRVAASRLGADGYVIASDISSAMLEHVQVGFPTGGPPLQILECSATDIDLPDGTVDVVFCQQGFPFVPDRAAAAREFQRVLTAGGRVGIAVWLSAERVEPFIIYGEALQACGVPEPFRGAYDSAPLSMSTDEVREALEGAGFGQIEVRVEQLKVSWPDPLHATRAVAGTPYGPVLAALDGETQEAFVAELARRMTAADGGAISHVMASVLARATAP